MISTPNYSTNPDISDCFWFLEAKDNEDTVVLSNSDFVSVQRMPSTTAGYVNYNNYGYTNYYITTSSPVILPRLAEAPFLVASFTFYILLCNLVFSNRLVFKILSGYYVIIFKQQIYDGWNNAAGPVLYNGEADAERRAVTYSISNKMMIHLISPVVREKPVFSWTVSRV